MCPDVQLLSVYRDDELPSPWKEKLESHLNECSDCRKKLDAFGRYIEKSAESELEMIESAKNRIWENIQSRKRFQPRIVSSNNSVSKIWERKLSIPIPAAAAAAIIITLVAIMLLRGGGQINNNGIANQHDPYEKGFVIAANDDEIPGIMPVADINGVLQYLDSDGAEIIILKLPESKNFARTGEPAILRAADFQQNDSLNNNSGRERSRNRRQQ